MLFTPHANKVMSHEVKGNDIQINGTAEKRTFESSINIY